MKLREKKNVRLKKFTFFAPSEDLRKDQTTVLVDSQGINLFFSSFFIPTEFLNIFFFTNEIDFICKTFYSGGFIVILTIAENAFILLSLLNSVF